MFLPLGAYNLLQIHILIKIIKYTIQATVNTKRKLGLPKKLDNITKHVMGGRDVVIETKESFYK